MGVINPGSRLEEEERDSSPRRPVEVNLQEEEVKEGEKTVEDQLGLEQGYLKMQIFTHLGRPKREPPLPWHNFRGRRPNLGQKEKLKSNSVPSKIAKSQEPVHPSWAAKQSQKSTIQ